MAELPDWQAFENGSIPNLSGDTRDGTVVAIMASSAAVGGGWAPDTAFELAAAWSSAGRRVVLVDAAVNNPTLHVAAALDNLEGLTDSTLFGVSVGRVARPIRDQSFFLITAGSPTADPGTLVDNERWQRLVAGFVEAGVTLLLFLGGDDEAATAFLTLAADVIVLADESEDAGAMLGAHAERLRAVLGPARTESTTALEGAAGVKTQQLDFASIALDEAAPSMTEVLERGAPASPGDSSDSGASNLRPPSASDSWGSGGRRNLLIVVVLLLVLALAVAYVMGLFGGRAATSPASMMGTG